mmetsp:Transcript_21006/g.48222  ORF Transcript_21006/g.48222 Transcript_21006/m.48222 type:complete len:218 (-) Transcript_21006:1172-1825(-)
MGRSYGFIQFPIECYASTLGLRATFKRLTRRARLSTVKGTVSVKSLMLERMLSCKAKHCASFLSMRSTSVSSCSASSRGKKWLGRTSVDPGRAERLPSTRRARTSMLSSACFSCLAEDSLSMVMDSWVACSKRCTSYCISLTAAATASFISIESLSCLPKLGSMAFNCRWRSSTSVLSATCCSRMRSLSGCASVASAWDRSCLCKSSMSACSATRVT